MNIVVCIDKNNGMFFNNRRQSQDAVLRNKVNELCNGARLFMSNYSGLQFSDFPDIIATDDFLSQAQNGDFCFIEDGVLPTVDSIENVFIFKWNRHYPADVYFELDLKHNGFKRDKKEDFVGSSHEKITLEIYKRGQI